MINREKFAEQILDITCEGDMIAIKDGNLCTCNSIPCIQCDICFAFNPDDTTDCRRRFKKWCESEYIIEKPKISENDRRFLDYLPEKAWMVRDKNGHLYLFCKNKPWKSDNAWYNEADRYTYLNKLLDIDFSMVKWEDEEPWLIEDLKKLEMKK